MEIRPARVKRMNYINEPKSKCDALPALSALHSFHEPKGRGAENVDYKNIMCPEVRNSAMQQNRTGKGRAIWWTALKKPDIYLPIHPLISLNSRPQFVP